MERTHIAFVTVIAAIVSGCSAADEAAITYPESQQTFSSINSQCQTRYSAGLNEIQKSLVFNECNSERFQFSESQPVSGWVGRIADISTDQGADVVSVTIESTTSGFDMKFGTVSNRLSDYTSGSMITQSNPLFSVLLNLKEGDMVSFDAVFLPHPEGARGIWESSLTEQGSMDEPEFNVRFTDIRPYGVKRVVINHTDEPTNAIASKTVTTHEPSEEAKEPEEVIHADGGGLNASFDCARAETSAEKTICSNSRLARVDAYTADMYGCLLKLVPESENKLRQSQRSWINRREECGEDVGCLRGTYGDIAKEYMQYEQFGRCQESAETGND